MIGLVTSRYGEAMTLSGTPVSASSQTWTNRAVSSGSIDTVSASSMLGRAALAKASARSVGLCNRLTSTTARTRLGSVRSSPSTRAVSRATVS
jgi:hypothetical protein